MQMEPPRALLDTGGREFRYRTLVGTGGIGTGVFFRLSGEHTLGREESRGGRFLERRDYCKLHIICHYVKALLGRSIEVVPIGKVGDDEAGERLFEEMREAGLELSYVHALAGASTLYSFCFLYPDGSGGNMTTEDSASGEVNARAVDAAEPVFQRAGGQGIALAVPEVPLETRDRLLRLATRHGLFRAASFATGEMRQVRRLGLLERVDLLALNRDEVRALAGAGDRVGEDAAQECEDAAQECEDDLRAGTERAIEFLAREFPHLLLLVTAGAEGSWSWDGEQLRHIPAIPVEVQTTGGAGDAHLAGTIAALAAGASVDTAHRLGAILAAASVTSPHTIHKQISRRQLTQLARRGGLMDEPLSDLFETGRQAGRRGGVREAPRSELHAPRGIVKNRVEEGNMNTTTRMVKKASQIGILIPAFNIPYLPMVKPVIRAVIEEDAFALLEVARAEWRKFGSRSMAAVYEEFQKHADPHYVGLHLDHIPVVDEDGLRVEYLPIIREAITLGYGSVMIDGSRLSLEENIRETRSVAELAHEAGIPCEAELGAVLGHEEGPLPPYEEMFRSGQGFTDPGEAARFVKESGCDWLSVAFGNVHGRISEAVRQEKKVAARLNIEHLKIIRDAVGIPLVLHGGSGIQQSYVLEAMKCGISKMNIGADIRQAYEESLRDGADEDGAAEAVYRRTRRLLSESLRLSGSRRTLL